MLYTQEQLDDPNRIAIPAGGELYVFPQAAEQYFDNAVADYEAEGYPKWLAREMACCEVEADIDDSREVAARM
jgi:hypothetical protein